MLGLSWAMWPQLGDGLEGRARQGMVGPGKEGARALGLERRGKWHWLGLQVGQESPPFYPQPLASLLLTVGPGVWRAYTVYIGRDTAGK